jgi:hypothetical protein
MKFSLLEFSFHWEENPEWRVAHLNLGIVASWSGYESSLLELGYGNFPGLWSFDILWLSSVMRKIKSWRGRRA